MFLYDHVLTYWFIFAPSDTTKFFFINWTNTQQVQLHPSVLSLLTWDSSVLEKQELGLISFSLLSFLKSRMRSNKSYSIYSCPYCCRGNQSQALLAGFQQKSMAFRSVHWDCKDQSRMQSRLLYRNCEASPQLAGILLEIHRTPCISSNFWLKH